MSQSDNVCKSSEKINSNNYNLYIPTGNVWKFQLVWQIFGTVITYCQQKQRKRQNSYTRIKMIDYQNVLTTNRGIRLNACVKVL